MKIPSSYLKQRKTINLIIVLDNTDIPVINALYGRGVVQYIETGDGIYSILNMLYPYDVSVVVYVAVLLPWSCPS